MEENKTNIFSKINDWFKAENIEAEVVEKTEVAEVVTENKFEDIPLVDGVTVLTAEPTLEVGSVVALTANGETIPAPAGQDGNPMEYELQDGRIVVVVEEGIIAEIKEAATEEGEEPTGEVVEEPMKEENKTNEKIKRLIERVEKEQIFEKNAESISKIEDLETKLAESESKYNALEAKFESFTILVRESFEAFSEEPTKQPKVKQSMPFASEKKKNYFKPEIFK